MESLTDLSRLIFDGTDAVLMNCAMPADRTDAASSTGGGGGGSVGAVR